MPWQEVNTVTLRQEFVMLATQEGSNIAALCRQFQISRDKGYKWLRRFAEAGVEGLADRSRRPHSTPNKTDDTVEQLIVALRAEHPTWGGRKLKARLEALGHQGLPVPSTVTEVLRRKGCINPAESGKHKAFIRFEHPCPNALWQMDFKGHFAIGQGRCHPLTAVDDHSRFNVLLKACADEAGLTVKHALIECFRRYGLPDRITIDNGSPWGGDETVLITELTAWLVRLTIVVSHSRPYHPQTQGKDERFHRTLLEDAIAGRSFGDLAECQKAFDKFRTTYNLERPHESLGMKPPVTRYTPSSRPFPERLPPIEYAPGDKVRKVQDKGFTFIDGRILRLPKALKGEHVAFRPTDTDGKFDVFYCHHKLTEVELDTLKKQ